MLMIIIMTTRLINLSVLTDSYGGQGIMVTLHQQQQQDTQHHTLSQSTSVGAISSDEIEEFEDDSSW